MMTRTLLALATAVGGVIAGCATGPVDESVVVADRVSTAPAPSAAWLSLVTNSEIDCAWTVTVNWQGFSTAKTLVVFVTETYTGAPLVPAFVAVRAKTRTATVTLAPLAPSARAATFYAWAALLDSRDRVIPGSVDFASPEVASCTAP